MLPEPDTICQALFEKAIKIYINIDVYDLLQSKQQPSQSPSFHPESSPRMMSAVADGEIYYDFKEQEDT
jgi:hypothetical protein